MANRRSGGAVVASPGGPELERIVAGRHHNPHHVLGLHDGVVRAYRPDAVAMRVLAGRGDGQSVPMRRLHPAGVFEAELPSGVHQYRLEADYGRAGAPSTFVFDDPYRAWPTVGEGQNLASDVSAT